MGGWPFNEFGGWLVDWLVGQFLGWFIDWLMVMVGCLVGGFLVG